MIATADRRACAPYVIGPPGPEHGARVHDLIARCPPLDRNSMYCNLLQCSHYRNTSAIALDGDIAVGFVSGYLVPEDPATLFIWQVAVAEQARGCGLAKALIRDILARPGCRRVRRLQTTITTRNTASWAMFHGLARAFGAATDEQPLFDSDTHFAGWHDTEHLLTIGPLPPRFAPS